MKTKAYDHQTRALQWVRDHGYCAALVMQRGTGKSYVALAAGQELLLADKIEAVLVLCPLTVAGHWQREVGKHTYMKAVVVDGSRSRRGRLLHEPAQVYIMGYDCAARTFGAKYLLGRWLQGKLLVVADESTWIKNPRAQRSKLLHKLGDYHQYRMILTGDPITDRYLEPWSQWRFYDRGLTFGSNYWAWRSTYFHVLANHIVIPKAGTPEAIRSAIRRTSYICTKAECLDLPPKLYETISVRMDGEQKRMYQQMAEESIAEIRDEFGVTWDALTAPTVLARLTRLRQLASGWLPVASAWGVEGGYHEVLCAKETALHDFLDQEWDGQPVVIWAWYRHSIERLANLCSQQSRYANGREGVVACEWMHGDTPRPDRDDIIERFQDGRVLLLVAQPRTGGVGIDLYRASHALYYENDWWNEPRIQSEDRLHRIGQEAARVLYTDLVTEGTIEVGILSRLREKEDLSRYVLGIEDVERLVYGEE